ncbi:gas vesicle protein GvpA [Halocatena pleomorpha]|uniref:Gas vesicle protein A n=1 Tax=Halocatena pleomorpha TaxID=1785090 RepID=A0A3P3RA36_9EURY|nr:gas vesicle structural protein GvpA [Halocatena pleomorpha]RRJ29540.1 gas vesicle structural protein GvpA [Halocatena pleomorpha]
MSSNTTCQCRGQRPDTSSLVEVIDRILDKGVVIDLWARVSIVGIEILTVEARIVVASVDTFLHYAKHISILEEVCESGDLEDLKNLEIGTSPMVESEPEKSEPQVEQSEAQ